VDEITLVGLTSVWLIRSGFQEFSQPRGRLSVLVCIIEIPWKCTIEPLNGRYYLWLLVQTRLGNYCWVISEDEHWQWQWKYI